MSRRDPQRGLLRRESRLGLLHKRFPNAFTAKVPTCLQTNAEEMRRCASPPLSPVFLRPGGPSLDCGDVGAKERLGARDVFRPLNLCSCVSRSNGIYGAADGTVVVVLGEGRYGLDRTTGTLLVTPEPPGPIFSCNGLQPA